MAAGKPDGKKAGFPILRAVLALSILSFCMAGSPRAQGVCPPGYPEGLPCPVGPAETVPQEHQDRVDRLKRLAAGTHSFEFHTTLIGAEEHGLADYPVDIPVLRVVANQDVFFDTGSDVIRSEANAMIDIIADSLMREPPDVSLFVAGHTDDRGDEEYNRRLGERRAQAVAAALVRRGIYQASVYRVSFGELVPMASNETANGRARNRRVEFLFSAQPQVVVKHLEKQEIALCAQKIDDRMDDKCRIPIQFNASRVEVPSDATLRVLELNEQELAINNDRSLTQIEREAQRKVIQLERERIPIVMERERIEIVLDPTIVPRASLSR